MLKNRGKEIYYLKLDNKYICKKKKRRTGIGVKKLKKKSIQHLTEEKPIHAWPKIQKYRKINKYIIAINQKKKKKKKKERKSKERKEKKYEK